MAQLYTLVAQVTQAVVIQVVASSYDKALQLGRLQANVTNLKDLADWDVELLTQEWIRQPGSDPHLTTPQVRQIDHLPLDKADTWDDSEDANDMLGPYSAMGD